MKLTWRDGVTSLLALAVVAIYFGVTRGIVLPLVTDYTGVLAITGVIAVVMGMIGIEQRDVEEGGWFATLLFLGLAAFVLYVASFFYATSQAMFLTVTISVVVLWAVGMIHHLVSASDHVGLPV